MNHSPRILSWEGFAIKSAVSSRQKMRWLSEVEVNKSRKQFSALVDFGTSTPLSTALRSANRYENSEHKMAFGAIPNAIFFTKFRQLPTAN